MTLLRGNCMPKYVLIILLHIVSVAYADSLFVKKISQMDEKNTLIVFLAGDEKTCEMLSNVGAAYGLIYDKYYTTEYKTSTGFLYDLLLRKIVIPGNRVKGTPYIIPLRVTKISKEYRKKGLNYIISRYLRKETLVFRLKKSLRNDEKNDLIRVMFKNNYICYIDDISGELRFE